MRWFPHLLCCLFMFSIFGFGCAPHNEGETLMKQQLCEPVEKEVKFGTYHVIRDPVVEFNVPIDRTMPMKDLFLAGKYDFVGDYVPWNSNDSRTSRPSGKEIMRVYFFDRHTRTKDIVKMMEHGGYQPANLRELLAFGAQFPDYQHKHMIVALGERVTTESLPETDMYRNSYPFLAIAGKGRIVQMSPDLWVDEDGPGWSPQMVPWSTTCFLAVRK